MGTSEFSCLCFYFFRSEPQMVQKNVTYNWIPVCLIHSIAQTNHERYFNGWSVKLVGLRIICCFHFIVLLLLCVSVCFFTGKFHSVVSYVCYELCHKDTMLNRSRNSVFLCLKIYWNRQVFDLIRASGIWMRPETLRHQASSSKL